MKNRNGLGQVDFLHCNAVIFDQSSVSRLYISFSNWFVNSDSNGLIYMFQYSIFNLSIFSEKNKENGGRPTLVYDYLSSATGNHCLMKSKSSIRE